MLDHAPADMASDCDKSQPAFDALAKWACRLVEWNDAPGACLRFGPANSHSALLEVYFAPEQSANLVLSQRSVEGKSHNRTNDACFGWYGIQGQPNKQCYLPDFSTPLRTKSSRIKRGVLVRAAPVRLGCVRA